MLRVLSAEKGIPRENDEKKIAGFLENGPVLITGNGGMGKTSLMMREAILWARSGGVAVWMKLDAMENGVFNSGKARVCLESLSRWARQGRRVLICLENPFWGRESLSCLRDAWMNLGLRTGRQNEQDGYIQIIMAERNVRLSGLANSRHDCLRNWFDGACTVELRGVDDARRVFRLKNYPAETIHEEKLFRRKLLIQSIRPYVANRSVNPSAWTPVLDRVMERYDRPNVSVVELIYRTLFALKQVASKDDSIILDWEEWGRGLRKRAGINESDARLYGAIAALNLFGLPMPLSLFCRLFDLKERNLTDWLRDWRISGNVEPVIYQPGNARLGGVQGTLRPKHDIIAELLTVNMTNTPAMIYPKA